MSNRNYEAGRRFEYAILKDLVACGFFVIRAAGSKGVADVVALHHALPPLLISAKVNGVIPPAERELLVSAAESCLAKPVLAERTKKGVIGYWVVNRGPEKNHLNIREAVNLGWLYDS